MFSLQRGAWTALVELGADVQAAIERAFRIGAITDFERLVIWLYYWHDRTLAEIADGFCIHEDVVRRSLHRAIKATGLLEGYGDLEDTLGSRVPGECT